jgi:hypothetical protein
MPSDVLPEADKLTRGVEEPGCVKAAGCRERGLLLP